MGYYDDNFGHYDDMDDEGSVEFYKHVQATNVEKECKGCSRMVRIQPDYAYCNSCADAIEQGTEF